MQSDSHAQRQCYSSSEKAMREPPPRPPPSRSQTAPSSQQKVKLLCSFNGTFLPCPPSGKLLYIGGDTRIVSIRRGIGISQLLSMISGVCPNSPSISLKYRILCHGGDHSLVPVETDDDVRRMMEEHDKLVADGKSVWLRLFACHGNVCPESNTSFSYSRDCFCSGSSSSNSNDVDLIRENSYGNNISMTHVAGTGTSGHFFTNGSKSKIRTTPLAGDQDLPVTDDSGGGLSSRLLERTRNCDCSYIPGNLASHMTGIGSSVGACKGDVTGPNNITGYVTEFRHLGSPCCLQESQLEPALRKFSNGSGLVSGQQGRTVEFQNKVCDLKQGITDFEGLNIRNLSKEHVRQIATKYAPVTSSDRLGRDLFPLDTFIRNNNGCFGHINCAVSSNQIISNSIRNEQTELNDTQRLCSDPYGVGDHSDYGFEGKPCNGRCYAGPESSCAHFGMPSYGTYDHNREGMGDEVSSASVTHHMFEHEVSKGVLKDRVMQPSNVRTMVDGRLETEFGNSDLQTNSADDFCSNHRFLELPNISHHVDCPSHSLSSIRTDPIQSFQAISLGHGLSCKSNLANCEVQSTHPHSNPFSHANEFAEERDNSSEYPLSSKLHHQYPSRESESVYDTANHSYNLIYHIHSTAKESDGDFDLYDKSSVGLSWHDLSHLSPTEVDPPSQSSSFISNDTAGSKESAPLHYHVSNNSKILFDDSSPKCEMWPYFNQLDLTDNKPLTEDVNEVGTHERECDYCNEDFDASVKNVAKASSSLKISGPFPSSVAPASTGTRADVDNYRERQQNPPSSGDVKGKVNIKESDCYSMVVNKIGSDLTAFYTQLLGTEELQTIRNSDLEEICELGSGTYGTVYHGKWRGCDVAIRRINLSSFAGDEVAQTRLVEDFWKEARLLSQLRHPNVVAFYGVVTDGPPKNFVTVTEYMVNGSLKKVLRRKDRMIDRQKRLIMAMDVAFGMEYLHEKNIMHFDLKSDNLLVNMRDPQRPVCKIGDLGLYKVKQKTLISGGIQGTIPWMAPELLASKSGMVAEKVDVYSFGMVMWELLTGDEPYANMHSEEILAGIIEGDLRPEVPNWCDPTWRSLMERCWSSDPNARPSFLEIGKELRALAASTNIK